MWENGWGAREFTCRRARSLGGREGGSERRLGRRQRQVLAREGDTRCGVSGWFQSVFTHERRTTNGDTRSIPRIASGEALRSSVRQFVLLLSFTATEIYRFSVLSTDNVAIQRQTGDLTICRGTFIGIRSDDIETVSVQVLSKGSKIPQDKSCVTF